MHSITDQIRMDRKADPNNIGWKLYASWVAGGLIDLIGQTAWGMLVDRAFPREADFTWEACCEMAERATEECLLLEQEYIERQLR